MAFYNDRKAASSCLAVPIVQWLQITHIVIAQCLDQLGLHQVDLVFEAEEDEDDAADVAAEEDEEDDDEGSEHAPVLTGRAAAAQEGEERQEAEHNDEDLEWKQWRRPWTDFTDIYFHRNWILLSPNPKVDDSP